MHRGGRESWRYCGRSFLGGRDYLCGGFAWPPRSYSCSFCRREFRSAQALGGHMNVHRRDRARLRQSPPWDPPPSNPTPNSNPNITNVPNLNMPTPSCSIIDARNSPVLKTFRSLLSPLEDTEALRGVRDWGSFMESGGERDAEMVMGKEKDQAVKLRMDVATACGDLENSMDLELRLGYP